MTRDEILYNYWAFVFPHLNNKDLKKATEYGLKELRTPFIFKEGDDLTTVDTLLMGTWNRLLDYAIDYLGYDIDIENMIYLGKDREKNNGSN